MLISKCRRLVGSAASGFESLRTIYDRGSERQPIISQALNTYLDPMVHLNPLIRGIEVDPLVFPSFLHHRTAR